MRLVRWRPARRGGEAGGAAALEFALVLPPFVALVVGGFYSAGLYFAASSMQQAVEAGARCASVNTSVCADNPSTVTYVRNHFNAAGAVSPVFAAASATCGHSVTATATYGLDAGLTQINVPLSASACFP